MVGEQRLPNKADVARKPGFDPPYVVDSEQQGLGRLSFAKPLRKGKIRRAIEPRVQYSCASYCMSFNKLERGTGYMDIQFLTRT